MTQKTSEKSQVHDSGVFICLKSMYVINFQIYLEIRDN